MSGHKKPAHARHRSDRGASAWVDYLRAAGVSYAHLGGAIDGVAWFGDRIALIDFKSSDKAPLTAGQGKLLAAGCPIHFVYSEATARLVATKLKARPRGEWETGQ